MAQEGVKSTRMADYENSNASEKANEEATLIPMMRIDTEEFFVGKDGGEEIGEIGDDVAMQSSSNLQPKMES